MHLFLALIACSTPVPTPSDARPPAATTPAPIEALDQPGYGLTELIDQAAVELPARAWPGEVPDRFSPSSLTQEGKHVRVALALPPSITRAHLVSGGDAFVTPPKGVEVTVAGAALPFSPRAKKPNSWGHDDKGLRLNLPTMPAPADVTVHLPDLAELQRAMEPAAEHVVHVARNGFRSTKGLLLPAPASATWSIVVPKGGAFLSTVRLLDPILPTEQVSDGATARVEILDDAGSVLADKQVELKPGKSQKLKLPLAAFAGKRVTLRLRTETGPDAALDYLYFIDPQVHATRKDGPRRVVLLFLDTLRRDRLGAYGYDARPVSPTLDAFAATATVFDDARTVAPWTLPSVRTALTGHQPERWAEVDNLAERMSAQGWATVARSTNAFVSATFDMDRGWGTFELTGRQPAPQLADYAEKVFGWYKDRDLLLMLQFMDAHTPYEESAPHRSMFIDEEPADVGFLDRLRKLDPDSPEFDAQRAYVEARYDQNIRAMDDAVARILAMLDDDDIVVVFSDHGEEFWDHGGFEHGHAFFDELLRVPLMVRAPGMPAGRVAAPVSLLDLTPTVLDLHGLEFSTQGRSLVGVAKGDAAADRQLRARSHAFGRPLYGADGWGVVTGGQKWFARGGLWAVYDLAADPGESKNIARPNTLRGKPEALSEALQRDVHEVWRVQLRATARTKDAVWEVSHPAGLDDAWLTYDPRGRFGARDVTIDDGVVRISMESDGAFPASVEVRGPKGSTAEGLRVTARGDGKELQDAVPGTATHKRVMLNLGDRLLGAIVERTWSPVPVAGVVPAYDADMAAELEALGYVE